MQSPTSKPAKSKEKIKSDNEKRSQIWFIKIHIPYDKPNFYPSYDELSSLFSHYAIIKHDKDVDDTPLDMNELEHTNALVKAVGFKLVKAPHFHIVGRSYSRTYFRPMKEKILQVFGLNDNLVTCDKALNLTASLRYLIHLDNPDKFQYSLNEVKTNNISWFMENICISEESFSRFVLSELEKCNGDYGYLIKQFGLSFCRRWQSVISQYFRVYYNSGNYRNAEYGQRYWEKNNE